MKKTRIDLTRPLDGPDGQITYLELDEPSLDALDGVELTVSGEGTLKFDLGALKTLLSSMAGIPPYVAGQVKAADMPTVAAAVMGFIGVSLPTGGKPETKSPTSSTSSPRNSTG